MPQRVGERYRRRAAAAAAAAAVRRPLSLSLPQDAGADLTSAHGPFPPPARFFFIITTIIMTPACFTHHTPASAWSPSLPQDAEGRFRNERVHYKAFCEEDGAKERAAAEKKQQDEDEAAAAFAAAAKAVAAAKEVRCGAMHPAAWRRRPHGPAQCAEVLVFMCLLSIVHSASPPPHHPSALPCSPGAQGRSEGGAGGGGEARRR